MTLLVGGAGGGWFDRRGGHNLICPTHGHTGANQQSPRSKAMGNLSDATARIAIELIRSE